MRLVIVDTAQIQPYIFGSNRLRENIGGSHLVAMVTKEWALLATREVAPNNNIKHNGDLDGNKQIDQTPGLDAEVIYAGGGNFVVLFRDQNNEARDFIRRLSRKALNDAPGLQLVFTHESLHWNEAPHTDDSLAEKVKATFKKLAQEKRERTLSAPLLGLAVTVMCQSTAMPAVGMAPKMGDDPERPASTETLAKLAVVQRTGAPLSEADKRLHKLLPPPDGFDYPAQFDHLGGTKGEHSYVAVVHADGDDMGSRIMKIGERYRNAAQNRDYINEFRSFSEAVEKAAQDALVTTVDRIRPPKIADVNGKKVIVHTSAMGKELVRIELRWDDKEDEWLLPFRPIVFGGDDMTFVCDGRLGLSLATEYVKQFENLTKTLPDGKGKLTASAGIAIVKSHYPFARAYALAAELCSSAKKYRRTLHKEVACLDWLFARSGLSGGIEEIRDREYKVDAGFLTLCPVTLDKNDQEKPRSWEVVQNAIHVFQGDGWAGRRNKLKALRDTLREGPDQVKWFLAKYGLGKTLPPIKDYPDFAENGWSVGRCGYFDAVELSDWYISL